MPKIGILLTSAMGDALLSIPLIRSIRAARPGSTIVGLVARPATLAFVRELHAASAFALDEVIALPDTGPRSLRSARRLGIALRPHRLDTLVQTFSSHGRFSDLACLFSRVRERAGFRSSPLSTLALNRRPAAQPADGVHRIDLNARVVRSMGIDPRFDGPAYLTLPERQSPPHHARSYVWFSVFADRNLQGKRWPMDRWAALGRRLVEEGLDVYVGGAAGDAAEAQSLVDAIGEGAKNMAGAATFVELADLMRRASAIVGTDGMPLHFADALGLPVVGLFGPTDPVEGGPFSARVTNSEIIRADGPVTYTNLTIDRGIGAEGVEQMSRIAVADVHGAIQQRIAHRHSAPRPADATPATTDSQQTRQVQ